MKTSAIIRLVTCATFALLAGTARAQLEGGLFTQPDEREYLDYLRQQFLLENAESGFDIEEVEIPEIPTDEVVAEETGPVQISFGGIMTRRDGGRSVWLNDSLLTEQQLPAGITIVTSERSASLRITQDGKIYVLRPGQTVELGTGTVIENFDRPQPEVVPPAPVPPPQSTAQEVDTATVAETPAEAVADESAPADAAAAPDSTPAVQAGAEAAASTNPERTAGIAEALSAMAPEQVNQLFEALQALQEDGPDNDEP